MEDTSWGRWLHRLTHETSVRAIAKRIGVSHTTVQRWMQSGVPPSKAFELCVHLKGDPIEVMVLLGRIQPQDVSVLNWAAIIQYAPAETLTAELHSRTVRALRASPEVDPKKRTVTV